MFSFFISLFLFDYLFSLFFEQSILFFCHLWVPKNILINKKVGFKGSFEYEAIMMFEYSTSFHSIFFPSSFIAIAVIPCHLTVLMISSFFKCSFVDILTCHGKFAFSLFLIFIPISLYK
jgi:hypothetical protein